MEAHAQGGTRMQKVGGIAALYIAVAYLAAIPYFVVLVNYPGVVDPVLKVILLRDNYPSMHLMHLLSFEFVAIGLIVLTLALYHRLKSQRLRWCSSRLSWGSSGPRLSPGKCHGVQRRDGSGGPVLRTDPSHAVSAWQAIEPIARALGGSGGEILGGVWILLLSGAALRTKVFPTALNWLGVGIGTAGILSSVPVLSGLDVVFGLLQIVWFFWLGIVMFRTKPDAVA